MAANYTAKPFDFVPCDTTAAPLVVALPAAPPDGTIVGVKVIVYGTGHNVTIAASGTDVFNKARGSATATLSLPGQTQLYQYNAALGVWYITTDDLPLAQLDTRYLATAGTAANATAVGAVTVTGTPSAGQVLTATSPSAADWQTGGGSSGVTSFNTRTGAVVPATGDYTWAQTAAAMGLNTTAVKTSAYTLSAGDWVPCNVSGGNFTLTLPNAPANGTRVGAKLVVNNTGATGVVTLACQGSDVFNVSGGATSGTLQLTSQGQLLQYYSGIWYVQADDLPLSQLDLRYQRLVAVGPPTGTYATDVATVSTAITNAGTYGTLYFPYSATAYNVDGLAPLTGQTWYGNATLQRPASSSASIVTATGINSFTMRGLTVDGNSSSTATSNAAIYLINTTFTLLENLTVQNCPSTNNAIILRGSVRGLIDACQITSCGYGIAIGLNHADAYSCYGNVIRNTMIDTTTWDAIFLTENLGSTGSVSVVGNVIGTVVTGCTVRNFGDCGIEIGSGTVHTEVSGCAFIGISNANGNNGILFRDAQHANVTGCTVSNLTKTGSNGVYSVNLNGNNAHNSINGVDVYNCGYGYLIVGGTSPTAIGTAAQDIAINGGTIDTTAADGIQLANVAGFNITGTQIHNAGNQGISIGKVSSTSASDGTITGARVFNSSQQTAGDAGIILFQTSADITITGCRIGDNQGASKTQAYGIRVYDSTVTNVKITSCDLTNGGTTANFSNNSSAANGVEVYACTGISPVGLRTAVTRPDATWDATDHGLIAWSYDATLAPEGSSAPVNGLVYLIGIQVRAPFTTTKGYFSCSSATTPAGTVAGENFLGLYNSAGTLCASAEIDSNLTSFTAGLQTITWSAGYTGPAGQYWVALLLNGTTNPTLYRAATSVDNATPNAGITTAANYRICKNGSGATALSAITPSSNTISSTSDSPRNWWVAIG
jgi:hypothetical protein